MRFHIKFYNFLRRCYKNKRLVIVLFASIVLYAFFCINEYGAEMPFLPASTDKPQKELGSLKEMVAHKAIDNTVIVTATNYAYMKMFENFLESIKRAAPHRVDMVFVIPEDSEGLIYLSRYHKNRVLNLSIDSKNFPKIASFPVGKSPRFTKEEMEIFARRPERLLSAAQLGVNIFYMDSDIVWLKDPWEDMKIGSDTEMALVPDVLYYYYYSNGILDEDKAQSDCYHNCCAGFIYMKPTDNVKQLLTIWSQLLRRTPGFNQLLFNKALMQMPQLKYEIMSPAQFPNGLLYFNSDYFKQSTDHGRSPRQPAVVHANYLSSISEKIQALKAAKLWYIED